MTSHQSFTLPQISRTFLFCLLVSLLACGLIETESSLAKQASAEKEVSSQQQEGSVDAFMGSPKIKLSKLFSKGRFPNVVVSNSGTIVATWGQGKVVAKRSTDGGQSWSKPVSIGKGIHGGGTTVDRQTGDILVFVEEDHPPAPIKMYRSTDDGLTWSESAFKIKPDSNGNMPSMHMNEHGITLERGEHAGRLIRATRFYAGKNDKSKWPEHYTNAMYSDDRGMTWQTSGPFPENGTGEAALTELSDGTLYYNSRVHWEQRPKNTRRRSAISRDAGATWEQFKIVEILPDGHQHRSYGCMGGLVRLPIAGQDILIFSNIDTPNAKRERGTVWASFDGGKTWPVKRLVFDGAFAYSSLTAGRKGTASEGNIYLHFESANGTSQFARFNLAYILSGEETGDGEIPTELAAPELVAEEAANEVKLGDQVLPLVFSDDLEKGPANWEMTDESAWDHKSAGGSKVIGLNRRKSNYEPKFRSPHNIALIKDIKVKDFVLTFNVRNTNDTGPHRDCCVFFAHQDPSNFYYAHLGARPDPNSGQIMIVKDAPRTPMTKNEKLVPWSNEWHTVKVTRESATGKIEIYFDDMETPQMSCSDKTFGQGRIGIGSFDDMNDYDNVRLWGR